MNPSSVVMNEQYLSANSCVDITLSGGMMRFSFLLLISTLCHCVPEVKQEITELLSDAISES